MSNFDLVGHYKKLVWFNFNRFEGDNYAAMRAYFADVFIRDIEEFVPLSDTTLIDVGGGNGEFCRVLAEKRNCRAVNLDPSGGLAGNDTVRGKCGRNPICRRHL